MLAILVAVAWAVARLVNLFAAVILFAIYSLASAALFVVLDAVDVAFTEAAVGAGVSTILMLAALARTSRRAGSRRAIAVGPLIACVLVGGLLIHASSDLPPVGAREAPAHRHVAPRYLERAGAETGVPNVVTAVLASYRGYDTLGEVTVIFTAGVGVAAILGLAASGRGAKRG